MTKQKRVGTTDLLKLRDLVKTQAKKAKASAQSDVASDLESAVRYVTEAATKMAITEAEELYRQNEDTNSP